VNVLHADKFFYCRLSPNHKVFHYGDCDENAVPTIEQLPSKCKHPAFLRLCFEKTHYLKMLEVPKSHKWYNLISDLETECLQRTDRVLV